MGNRILKLNNNSVRVAIGAFALFLLVSALKGLGIIEIPEVNLAILSLTSVCIIFIEIGLVRMFGGGDKKKGLDIFNAMGLFSAIAILLVTALDFVTYSLPALDAIRGFIFAVLFVSFAIETVVR